MNIAINLDQNPPRLSVRASSKVMEDFNKDVMKLKQKIEMQKHHINSPGMPQYFNNEAGLSTRIMSESKSFTSVIKTVAVACVEPYVCLIKMRRCSSGNGKNFSENALPATL